MKTKIFILGLILLLVSTGHITQCNLCDILYDYGTIYGNVNNEQGNPIGGVTIEVFLGPSTIVYTTTTDSLGEYLIEDIPFGSYHFYLSMPSMNLYTDRFVSIGPENAESSFSCSPVELKEDFILTECE